jgi:uncharacterized protein
MLRARTASFVALGALAGATLISASAWCEARIPDAPAQAVTDNAGWLTPDAAARLAARLADCEKRTGHQVIVYVDRTTSGVPVEDWTVKAFARWQVGRKGIDDGVALVVFADDRRARIEVGYGLEDALPDAAAARIIDETFVPKVRAGDRAGAVEAAAGAIVDRIDAAGGARDGPDTVLRELPAWALFVGASGLVLLLILFATNPSLSTWLLFFLASRGDGGGGRRGGFFGGGGRSGGGGASGAW